MCMHYIFHNVCTMSVSFDGPDPFLSPCPFCLLEQYAPLPTLRGLNKSTLETHTRRCSLSLRCWPAGCSRLYYPCYDVVGTAKSVPIIRQAHKHNKHAPDTRVKLPFRMRINLQIDNYVCIYVIYTIQSVRIVLVFCMRLFLCVC